MNKKSLASLAKYHDTCKTLYEIYRNVSYDSAISFLRYISNAAVIEGAFTEGASISRRNPASRTALAVVAPKQPILTSSCLNSGKFFNKESIPDGLKNNNMS